MKPILLNEQQIKNQLAINKFSQPYKLHLFTTIGSTNSYLKETTPSLMLDVCCAEQQTQGRGRFARHWHSPFAENIYCSSRWRFNCELSKLVGLSLITSLAVLATVKALCPSPEIKVKWPNDLLWGDKKLCGSLIELITEPNGAIQVIIGIGLNVNTDTKNNPLPEKPWCSLFEIAQQPFNRNIIIANLLLNLNVYLNKFMTNGLEAFIEEWNKHDCLAGNYITVNQACTAVSGTAGGINKAGQLLLVDEQGITHCLSSGDTSIGSLGKAI
ncbi:MAG: biotin--[acetyl-CoA-carboxylase] ligase [Legionellales bacterium]